MNNCFANEKSYRKAKKEEAIIDRVAEVTEKCLTWLFAFLHTMANILCDRRVHRGIRVVLMVFCFFAFIGLVGGIERGMLSLGLGVICGMGLIFVEIFCLK